MDSRRSWIALLPLIGLASSVEAAGLYRWVDEKGQVNYSDRVPPNAAQAGHARLDAQGRVTQQYPAGGGVQRGAAPSELTVDEDRARQDRLNRDRALLSTYTTIEDIERLRRDRLAPIEAQLRRIEAKREKLSAALADAESNRKRLLDSSKPVPAQLDENIAEYQRQISAYEVQVAAHEQQRAEINRKFDEDRTRFTELKAEMDAANPPGRRN